MEIMEVSKINKWAWSYIRKFYPRKYARLQKDIKVFGKGARILFAQGLEPIQLMVSY